MHMNMHKSKKVKIIWKNFSVESTLNFIQMQPQKRPCKPSKGNNF
jgi:hypothetical protein